MQYKNNSINNFIETFAKITITMNLVAMICFFKATYYSIFEYLLAVSSKNGGFFGLISIFLV